MLNSSTVSGKKMNDELILLQEIKFALWILIYLVGIGVAFSILRVVVASYRTIKNELDNIFYNSASAMYENDDYDELIKYCHEHLKKKPKEAYCYWFLGKVYFQRKEYDDAVKYFEKTIEIYPSWEGEWVSPYLKKIEAAKQLNTV